MRLYILFLLLPLVACGGKIATLPTAVSEEAIRQQQQEIQHRAELDALHQAAISALEEADRRAQRLVDELNDARLLAEEVPMPVIIPPKPVVKTITRERPVYVKDGSLDAQQETILSRAAQAKVKELEEAKLTLNSLRASLQAAQTAIDAMQPAPPLERYGPGGLIAFIVGVVGYLIGYKRRSTYE